MYAWPACFANLQSRIQEILNWAQLDIWLFSFCWHYLVPTFMLNLTMSSAHLVQDQPRERKVTATIHSPNFQATVLQSLYPTSSLPCLSKPWQNGCPWQHHSYRTGSWRLSHDLPTGIKVSGNAHSNAEILSGHVLIYKTQHGQTLPRRRNSMRRCVQLSLASSRWPM